MAKESFTTLGAQLADLDAAWQDRLADAQASFASGRHAVAITSALYALEIRLKVLICKRLDLVALPKQFEIHDLPSLLLLAGLSRRIERKKAIQVKKNWDDAIVLAKQLNDMRYKPDHNWPKSQAAAVLHQLLDPPDGVFPWLSKQR